MSTTGWRTTPGPGRPGVGLCLALLLALCLAARGGLSTPAAAAAGPPEVVVSAASSLVDVLAAIGQAYERETGERVAVNAGASNTLARQILAGAPVDVFISADEAQMDVAARALEPGTRAAVVRNQLAVAVPAASAARLRALGDLTQPSFRRVAIGDPAAVPAGVYARDVLRRLALWDALEPRLIPMPSVRFALAAVESGAADAAIVYRTDVIASRRARAAFVLPVAAGPAILYPAAVVRSGRNKAGGRRFLAFLRSTTAVSLFEKAGFLRVRP
ncbi:MAG: molybdate ABC transporter substrate-binding protein [Vicinamibacterales bacterium]